MYRNKLYIYSLHLLAAGCLFIGVIIAITNDKLESIDSQHINSVLYHRWLDIGKGIWPIKSPAPTVQLNLELLPEKCGSVKTESSSKLSFKRLLFLFF